MFGINGFSHSSFWQVDLGSNLGTRGVSPDTPSRQQCTLTLFQFNVADPSFTMQEKTFLRKPPWTWSTTLYTYFYLLHVREQVAVA